MKFSFSEIIFRGRKIPNYIGITGLLLIIIFFINNIIGVRFIQDDAYTSFRYAKNFAEGNGLVFNPGERVEGYTNFLWVIILSLFFFVDRIHLVALNIENVAQILSVLFSISALVLTFLLSRAVFDNHEGEKSLTGKIIDEIFMLVPVFLFSVSTPLIYWGVSAMETSLFVSFTLLSLLLCVRNDNINNLSKPFVSVSILNSLVRPEGMIVFALILFYKILKNYSVERQGKLLTGIRAAINKNLLKEILLYSIPLLIYILFRLIYYGYPLPNTFYAKTEFSSQFLLRGLRYFSDFAAAYLLYGAVLLLPLILFLNKKNKSNHLLFFWFIAAWIVINILIGGDVLPIYRFFLPVMPLIFILFIKSVYFLINLISDKLLLKRAASAAAISLLIFAGLFNYGRQRNFMMEKYSYESGLVKKMKIYAGWIEAESEKRGKRISVAMSTIGAFSFYSGAGVIDIVGLTDKYISHHPEEVAGIDDELPVLWKERRYNAGYVISQKPDYIIFPAGAKPSAFAECALFVQNEFRQNYYTQIFYSDELQQMLPLFTRQDYKNAWPAEGECDIRYLKHFINANDHFLEMIRKKDKSLLKSILSECDSVKIYCAGEAERVQTLKGMAYYHAGDYESAGKYLLDASANDPANSIARYYMMKIFISRQNRGDAARMISEIVRYSPDAFPNIIK